MKKTKFPIAITNSAEKLNHQTIIQKHFSRFNYHKLVNQLIQHKLVFSAGWTPGIVSSGLFLHDFQIPKTGWTTITVNSKMQYHPGDESVSVVAGRGMALLVENHFGWRNVLAVDSDLILCGAIGSHRGLNVIDLFTTLCRKHEATSSLLEKKKQLKQLPNGFIKLEFYLSLFYLRIYYKVSLF